MFCDNFGLPVNAPCDICMNKYHKARHTGHFTTKNEAQQSHVQRLTPYSGILCSIPRIVLDNSVAPNRRQTIIWTNAGFRNYK